MSSINQAQALEILKKLSNIDEGIKNILSSINDSISEIETNANTLINANGKRSKKDKFTTHTTDIPNTQDKRITKIQKWSTWSVSGASEIKSALSSIISKVSEIEELTNQINTEQINAQAVLELMSQYNIGIESILAAGITIPEDFLDKVYTASELSTKIAWDEYAADRGEWVGISAENKQWWIDKTLKFVKDPNGLGTNAWLVMQQDENGNWVGMGWTDEETALGYAKSFGSAVEGEVNSGSDLGLALGSALSGTVGSLIGSNPDTIAGIIGGIGTQYNVGLPNTEGLEEKATREFPNGTRIIDF